MNLKKKAIIYATLACTLLVSCTNKSKVEDANNIFGKTKIEYYNLGNDEINNNIKEELKTYLSEEDIGKFFSQVEDFNKVQNSNLLAKDGYKILNTAEPSYDMGSVIQKWEEKYPKFTGFNCRLTSFSLINDRLDLQKNVAYDDSLLFIDKEAMSNANSPYDMSEEEKEKFKTLFSAVKTEDSLDSSIHIKSIEDYYKVQNIKFDLGKASIISVWFYDDLDEVKKLFVGHIGLLFPSKEGYLFIEKISFEAPYQVIKIKDRNDLNTYLMTKYEEQREGAAKPIIMENTKVLKEYKALYK